MAKTPQIRLQVVSRGSRWFQVSNSIGSNKSGTYARAPYAFAALGQGPKGPELQGDRTQTVTSNFDLTERKHAINFNLKVDSDQGRLEI